MYNSIYSEAIRVISVQNEIKNAFFMKISNVFVLNTQARHTAFSVCCLRLAIYLQSIFAYKSD